MKRVFQNPNPGARDWISLAVFVAIYGLGLTIAAAPALVVYLFG